jgi:hypothetical protein
MQRPTAEYGGFWQQGQQPARRDMHPPPDRKNTFEPRFVPPDVMAGKQAYRPHQQEKIWMQAPHQNFPGWTQDGRQHKMQSRTTVSDSFSAGSVWEPSVRRSCRRVNALGVVDGAPFGAGRNFTDTQSGRVTTQQMEYRAPPPDALAQPATRRRAPRRWQNDERLQPQARPRQERGGTREDKIASFVPPGARWNVRLGVWEPSSPAVKQGAGRLDGERGFVAKRMPDWEKVGAEAAKELAVGGRRGLRRTQGHLARADAVAHRLEIKAKRHRQLLLRQEMQQYQERQDASPQRQANELAQQMQQQQMQQRQHQAVGEAVDELVSSVKHGATHVQVVPTHALEAEDATRRCNSRLTRAERALLKREQMALRSIVRRERQERAAKADLEWQVPGGKGGHLLDEAISVTIGPLVGQGPLPSGGGTAIRMA